MFILCHIDKLKLPSFRTKCKCTIFDPFIKRIAILIPTIDVIIPVFNEEEAITKVLRDIPKDLVRYIIVCDNGSTDQTSKEAQALGAIVVYEANKGYGNACLKGMSWIESQLVHPEIVVFLDGDYSDFPQEMTELVRPIIHDGYDLVIGSRALGRKEKGAMLPQQIFGNYLATRLISIFFDYRFTDLGPFRAIRYEALRQIKMSDKTFGWTVEMQVKVAKYKLKATEIPVNYRKRLGKSKVSGTIKGTIMAGYKILWTIFKSI